jgi:hypothetical protein
MKINRAKENFNNLKFKTSSYNTIETLFFKYINIEKNEEKRNKKIFELNNFLNNFYKEIEDQIIKWKDFNPENEECIKTVLVNVLPIKKEFIIIIENNLKTKIFKENKLSLLNYYWIPIRENAQTMFFESIEDNQSNFEEFNETIESHIEEFIEIQEEKDENENLFEDIENFFLSDNNLIDNSTINELDNHFLKQNKENDYNSFSKEQPEETDWNNLFLMNDDKELLFFEKHYYSTYIIETINSKEYNSNIIGLFDKRINKIMHNFSINEGNLILPSLIEKKTLSLYKHFKEFFDVFYVKSDKEKPILIERDLINFKRILIKTISPLFFKIKNNSLKTFVVQQIDIKYDFKEEKFFFKTIEKIDFF